MQNKTTGVFWLGNRFYRARHGANISVTVMSSVDGAYNLGHIVTFGYKGETLFYGTAIIRDDLKGKTFPNIPHFVITPVQPEPPLTITITNGS